MKICTYRIIEASNLRTLERRVNAAAQDGFLPVGGMAVIPDLETATLTFGQPVARMHLPSLEKIVRKVIRKRK